MKGRIFKIFVALLLLGVVGQRAHAGTVTYVYTDPQGTPLAEADASGVITVTFDYKPYGSQALGTPKAGPGYTGHVNDPDTGFVYMQARYYDPVVGRFLSRDPQRYTSLTIHTFNGFAYANNNPLQYVDPNGRFPQPAPLFSFNLFNKEIDSHVRSDIVTPLAPAVEAGGFAMHQFDSNFKITLTEQGGAVVAGTLSADVLHPSDAELGVTMGQGGSVSLDFGPRNPFKLSMFNNSGPGAAKLTFTVSVGLLAHAAIDGSVDSNGNLELAPKVGVGVGEFTGAKVTGDFESQFSVNLNEYINHLKND